jgi:hypothetical protein
VPARRAALVDLPHPLDELDHLLRIPEIPAGQTRHDLPKVTLSGRDVTIEWFHMRETLLEDEGTEVEVLNQMPDKQSFQEQLFVRVVAFLSSPVEPRPML